MDWLNSLMRVRRKLLLQLHLCRGIGTCTYCGGEGDFCGWYNYDDCSKIAGVINTVKTAFIS